MGIMLEEEFEHAGYKLQGSAVMTAAIHTSTRKAKKGYVPCRYLSTRRTNQEHISNQSAAYLKHVGFGKIVLHSFPTCVDLGSVPCDT